MSNYIGKVLVACEYSGTVRDAFASKGWYAVSCDLLPTESIGEHYLGDVKDIINQDWDMLIAFPPCTYLCSSGMHWTTRGLRDPNLTEEAVAFVKSLYNANIKHIALENPVGILSSRIGRPSQILQPWQFGHPRIQKDLFVAKEFACAKIYKYFGKTKVWKMGQSNCLRKKQAWPNKKTLEN